MATPCYEKVIYGPNAGGTPDPDADVIIPFTGSHTLRSEVIYGDDEIQPLYMEHHLDLEVILYLETLTSSSTNIEQEAERVRTILSTPSLQLKLHPVGLGEIGTINASQPDVKGGPFPQSVFVQPIASNNAIMVRWSVMFRTVKCASPLSIPLLQYNVEQDMNVDDDGDMEFTTNITYQSKDPITDPNTKFDLVNLLIQRASKSFQGMTKTTRTSMSRDQRILSIRLVYKEIKSDNAFFPHTSNIDIDDTMESDLFGSSPLSGQGFYTWRRTISGTVRLPSRIHKAYAWVVIVKIIRARFKRMYLASKIGAVFDATPDSGQEDTEAVKETDYFLPLRLRITNPIYSRELRFESVWVVVTDLQNLFHTSKLFARVNTSFTGVEEESEPDTLSEQWLYWQQSRDRAINGRFRYTIDGTPIVYDQCLGTYTDHAIGPNRLLDLESDPDWDDGEDGFGEGSGQTDQTSQAFDGLYPLGSYNDLKYSWIDYDNDFEIIEDTNSIPVSYLEQPAANYYNTPEGEGGYADRAYDGLTINGRQIPRAQTNPSITIERGHSTFFIRMKGYAIRIGHKIPIPYIVSVGTKTAYRISSKSSHKQIGKGDNPIYLAKWDITYQVAGGDINNEDILPQIVTTGAPASYR